MAKYSFEFKKKVVISYLTGEESYDFFTNKYGIAASSKLKVWVKVYTIEKYIKYYNEQQIKEKLNWMSPVEYRLSIVAV